MGRERILFTRRRSDVSALSPLRLMLARAPKAKAEAQTYNIQGAE